MMLELPDKGLDKDALYNQMEAEKSSDADWRNAKSWSLVYYAGDEHTEFLKRVYGLYFSENGLSPTYFPSLRKFEAEVVSMMLTLLGAQGGEAGTMTSGGTESILLSLKTYRDLARKEKPEITKPELILPVSAHPAFLKGCSYFDITPVPVELDNEYRADLAEIESKITENTIAIVASAPSFPQGVIDPVEEIGQIALDRNIGLHVDACLGGFLLPFVAELGYKVRKFDFSVPGVTSISADLHKNGYAAKGASAVLYKTSEMRNMQFFVTTQWPGGIYSSPSMTGTRPGGAIAAAWAAMMTLGKEGYRGLAKKAMDTAHALMEGVRNIEGLEIIGEPDMTVFTFTSKEFDIFQVAETMEARGWRLDRQNNPDCIHMIATPNHEKVVDSFLSELRSAVNDVRLSKSGNGVGKPAMMYGVTANIPAGIDSESFIREQMGELYDRTDD